MIGREFKISPAYMTSTNMQWRCPLCNQVSDPYSRKDFGKKKEDSVIFSCGTALDFRGECSVQDNDGFIHLKYIFVVKKACYPFKMFSRQQMREQVALLIKGTNETR